MLMDRILGVFKLRAATFEEVEHDPGATSQSALIVLVVALLAGAGSGIEAVILQSNPIVNFIAGLVWALLGWLIISFIAYFVGTSLFGGKATLSEMLRVIGFAYAPQALAIIPCIGAFIGAIWSLVAGFIAVRQGLDLDDIKAFLTILVGIGVYIVGRIILSIVISGATALIT